MKIAYFSPLSPVKSGISIYSESNLLPYLSKYCEIDVIIDENYKPTNEYVKNNFPIIPYKKFDRKKYDIIIYQLGNNTYHEYIYNTLQNYPGIVVVHDPFIGGLIWNLTIARQKPESYIEHLVYCLGENGKKIAENAIASNNYPSFDHPLIKKVTDSSLGIIVHSDFAKQAVLKESPNAFVKKNQASYSSSRSEL